MSHTNAALTPRHRLKVAQLVVDEHWPISEVAARFQVSWPTVKRWVLRYLAGESMQDRFLTSAQLAAQDRRQDHSALHQAPTSATRRTCTTGLPAGHRRLHGPSDTSQCPSQPAVVHRPGDR